MWMKSCLCKNWFRWPDWNSLEDVESINGLLILLNSSMIIKCNFFNSETFASTFFQELPLTGVWYVNIEFSVHTNITYLPRRIWDEVGMLESFTAIKTPHFSVSALARKVWLKCFSLSEWWFPLVRCLLSKNNIPSEGVDLLECTIQSLNQSIQI